MGCALRPAAGTWRVLSVASPSPRPLEGHVAYIVKGWGHGTVTTVVLGACPILSERRARCAWVPGWAARRPGFKYALCVGAGMGRKAWFQGTKQAGRPFQPLSHIAYVHTHTEDSVTRDCYIAGPYIKLCWNWNIS
eukprot:6200002-Pleurochrysis_carterae.AAC.1